MHMSNIEKVQNRKEAYCQTSKLKRQTPNIFTRRREVYKSNFWTGFGILPDLLGVGSTVSWLEEVSG